MVFLRTSQTLAKVTGAYRLVTGPCSTFQMMPKRLDWKSTQESNSKRRRCLPWIGGRAGVGGSRREREDRVVSKNDSFRYLNFLKSLQVCAHTHTHIYIYMHCLVRKYRAFLYFTAVQDASVNNETRSFGFGYYEVAEWWEEDKSRRQAKQTVGFWSFSVNLL